MQNQLDVSLEQRGQEAVVTLSGELERTTVHQLTAVLAVAARSASRVLVDLRGLSFMDGGGLRAILDAYATAARADHDFELIRGPRIVQRVFELTDTESRLRFVSPQRAAPALGDTGMTVVRWLAPLPPCS